MKEIRPRLVNAIIDLAGDEFESYADLQQLASENLDALVERLINIAEYYRHQYNEAI